MEEIFRRNLDSQNIEINDEFKFQINDIISFQVKKKYSDNSRLIRAISNYGYEEIKPKSNVKYKITRISTEIENVKSEFLIDKSKNNTDIFLYVLPVDFELKENDEIFWFININKHIICQFEDGESIYSIENLIKH